jgi:hypothetical protein
LAGCLFLGYVCFTQSVGLTTVGALLMSAVPLAFARITPDWKPQSQRRRVARHGDYRLRDDTLDAIDSAIRSAMNRIVMAQTTILYMVSSSGAVSVVVSINAGRKGLKVVRQPRS